MRFAMRISEVKKSGMSLMVGGFCTVIVMHLEPFKSNYFTLGLPFCAAVGLVYRLILAVIGWRPDKRERID